MRPDSRNAIPGPLLIMATRVITFIEIHREHVVEVKIATKKVSDAKIGPHVGAFGIFWSSLPAHPDFTNVPYSCTCPRARDQSCVGLFKIVVVYPLRDKTSQHDPSRLFGLIEAVIICSLARIRHPQDVRDAALLVHRRDGKLLPSQDAPID